MVQGREVPGGAGSRGLPQLATDVRQARQVVHARRAAPVVWEDLVKAQCSLLQAMEVYVSALTVRRLPIPHRLRDDLRLQRELWGRLRLRHDPDPERRRDRGL